MNGGKNEKKKKTQGRNEGKCRRERKQPERAKGETVVLFSLVWHYLSLLINPLRRCAWRSEG